MITKYNLVTIINYKQFKNKSNLYILILHLYYIIKNIFYILTKLYCLYYYLKICKHLIEFNFIQL